MLIRGGVKMATHCSHPEFRLNLGRDKKMSLKMCFSKVLNCLQYREWNRLGGAELMGGFQSGVV